MFTFKTSIHRTALLLGVGAVGGFKVHALCCFKRSPRGPEDIAALLNLCCQWTRVPDDNTSVYGTAVPWCWGLLLTSRKDSQYQHPLAMYLTTQELSGNLQGNWGVFLPASSEAIQGTFCFLGHKLKHRVVSVGHPHYLRTALCRAIIGDVVSVGSAWKHFPGRIFCPRHHWDTHDPREEFKTPRRIVACKK